MQSLKRLLKLPIVMRLLSEVEIRGGNNLFTYGVSESPRK